MRARPSRHPMNTRTPDSQYPWTKKWGAGQSIILAKGGCHGHTAKPPRDPGLQAGLRDRSDMARRKQDRDAKPPNMGPDGNNQEPLADDLLRALRGILSIPGVEGIGQPVTVISPSDLPPDFLGLVERLRAGAVEEDNDGGPPLRPRPMAVSPTRRASPPSFASRARISGYSTA
jgi:hypothetical protein